MSEPVCVLYVTHDATTADRLESLFAAEESALSLSFVTSADAALAVFRARPVDRVVVDVSLADELLAAVRRADLDVPIHEIRGPDRRSESERVRAVADRVESAITVGVATDGSGNQFRTLAETLSDALVVVDADSVVRFANPTVEDVFGYDPDELVGESLTTLMPSDSAERHRAAVRRYLDTGERTLDWSGVELVGRRKDGTEVPVRISFGEFTADGDVRFTGVIRDVSEQHRREEELRRRIRQQRGVASFSRLALEDRPLDDLFDEAVELVADALDHDYAKVLQRRPGADDLLLRAGVGWHQGIVGSITVGTNRDSQAGYTLLSEEPVVVEDLDAEDRFSGPELLTSHGVTSGVSTVVGSSDDPWGILAVHDTDQQSYADHDVQFVQSVAHLLATAIRRHEREHELQRRDAMLDAVGDGVYALDADSRFVAVNDAYLDLTGYSREELLGAHVSTVVGAELSEEVRRVREALEAGRDVVTMEVMLPTKDGGSVPVEARITPLKLDDELFRVSVVRDVTERNRREEKLTTLTERTASLADAETSESICEAAVDAAIEVLGFPNAAVALYDDAAGTLVPAVQRWSEDGVVDALLGPDGVAWRTFVESESRMVGDLEAETDATVAPSSGVAVPLGKHGVFLAAAPERNAFDATDRSLADLLCSNVRSVLDRAEREETLRERRDELRSKNRELERTNRINAVVRELAKAVTRASSPDEVTQAVCDRLTESGLYRFAWSGTYDRATDEVEPRTWAGVEEGYLDAVVVTADDESPRGRGPSGRAVRTEDVQVQNDLLGDPPFEPWREQALKRGYRSSASIPIAYGGTIRGVLNLYAGEPGVFDDTEREVLEEFGGFVGYALNALEQRQALASERSVELDFRIRGSTTPVLEFVSTAGAEFEFESTVQRGDGQLHAFFTIRNATNEETLAFAEDVTWIEDLRLVADRGSESLYEVTLGEGSFLRTLLDRAAFPRTVTATDGEGRFVVRISRDADVRTFVNLFEDYFDDVELVARRERDEPVTTRQDFEAELADRLTDRQREVARMAYFGGFFEWPRESTAEELADALDVSQPTVSRHLRRAERALFGLLFEDR